MKNGKWLQRLPWKVAQWPAWARVITFLGVAVALWFPVAWPFYRLSGQGRLPGGDLVPTAMLYLVFLALLPQWQRRVHGLRQPWRSVGFTGVWRLGRGFGIGLGLGIISIVALGVIQWGAGWATLNAEAIATNPWSSILLGAALTALAVGWAEEILFRGWLLGELERGLSARVALIANSLIFAVAHFIKPPAVMLQMLPQFFGLFLLGMVLVWARRVALVPIPREDSLGPAVGLHSGLVGMYYVFNVGHLLQPTGRVPAWVTGLDGNPLAGLLGITLLTALGLGFCRWVAQSQAT
ncbi:CAAX protease family protein [Leptolyngbya sp. BL0902]|uniref:CPBP family intramembrane glutamic endopeptidase n=1 Tax=Leptolyngbya sp. BL0902 TaxID=1115757 RepID=UPI0018E8892F|nr:type II CAAX endopeptidase family protein [Leptolyngbya sp. BL0902]QQE63891.1 CAAX protease family protein [Leptolyngbya sp. BL0902]